MAKQKKTLDDATLRAMANMASSSSDLSKLQENFGWNAEDPATTDKAITPPADAPVSIPAETPAPVAPTTQNQVPALAEVTPEVIAAPKETTATADESPVKSVKTNPEAASAKKVNKYSDAFLEPISGFERPTKVAYISKRTHSYISLLQRYASLTGSKVSMQEIMENIFREHFADNKTEIEAIRASLLQKEAELHE